MQAPASGGAGLLGLSEDVSALIVSHLSSTDLAALRLACTGGIRMAHTAAVLELHVDLGEGVMCGMWAYCWPGDAQGGGQTLSVHAWEGEEGD